MNPIAYLTGKSFDELTANDLVDVMNAYCDQNKYETHFDYETVSNLAPIRKRNVITRFYNQIGDISLLETYFKYWTE